MDPMISRSLEAISVTAVLVFCIIVMALVIKKLNLHKISTKRGFEVISQQNVGVREKLMLVSFANKHLLIGVSSGGIHLLSDTFVGKNEKNDESFVNILQKEEG